ncbi:SDR family oxidoreductase [Sphaerisporangium sp. NPDC049002]|uniref:SDR family oxidoreductase n=1 Tax=Sphaerisporangium sp. NPDC049002 TaxID=3155392 RepID=UPI0033FB1797
MTTANGRRVVVITGASAGIGRAAARRFAGMGDAVALLARGADGLEGAARDVRQAGGEALAIEVDTADHEQVDAAAGKVESELGPIDVWVNVAFASVFAPFTKITPDEFRRATEVTYLGFVNGTRAALDRMIPRDHGVVVQVGSALAYRGIPLQSAYCGAKHAIQGFNESVRCELLHDKSKVRVTMVQLPAVNTPQFDWVLSRLPGHPQPVPPIYQPEIPADAVVYAADHPRRREYWVGGSTAATLLANAVAPGVLDRYLAWMGYRSQQTKHVTHRDPPNLWRPADTEPGTDQGAHGSFDDRAKSRSVQLWASQHHGLLTAVTATFATGLGALALAHRLKTTRMTGVEPSADLPHEGIRAVRAIEAGRAAWGLVLLTVPARVICALGGRRDRTVEIVARLLGARQLGQAAMSGLRPSRSLLVGGAVIDLVHAATALALGTVDDRWRRVALADAAIALGWSLNGLRDSTKTGRTTPSHSDADRVTAASSTSAWTNAWGRLPRNCR